MAQMDLWFQLLVQLLTLGTLVWGLMKMFGSAREANLARQVAVTASQRAEEAALAAAQHVQAASQVVEGMAATIEKLEVNTNSIKDALIVAKEKEAFARGQQEEREKPTPPPGRRK